MGTKVKRDNFIVIPGWAVTELGLKGNDLLIYSIIYGFSQTEGQCFCGSLKYLQDWTNSTRQGVIKNLDNLLSLGLIEKKECLPTNEYRVCKQSLHVNSVTEGVNSVTDSVNLVNNTSELSLHNNINSNKEDKYKLQKDFNEKVENIITHFNTICHTRFKSNTSATRKLIKRHFNEGFDCDDFKRVIELKYQDWGVSPVRFSNGQMSNEFLRPSTLFGDKFEGYVYEALARQTSEGGFVSESVDVDEDVSDLTF